MGIISDLLTSPSTFTGTGVPHVASSRVLYRKLVDIAGQEGDFDYPSGTAAANEVQKLGQHVHADGGTYTLSFSLNGGTTFSTANIAYNATNATMTGAINTAATGASVTGWTNGDIVVAGGPLSAANSTLTFSGVSVTHKNHGQTTIDGTHLTNSNAAGTAGVGTTTTEGQGNRTAWAALMALGLISSTPPAQGDDASGVTAAIQRGHLPHKLDDDSVKMIIDEAAAEDGGVAAVKTQLLAAMGY